MKHYAKVTIPLAEISPAMAAIGRHLGNYLMFEPLQYAEFLLPLPPGVQPVPGVDGEQLAKDLRGGPNAVPVKSIEFVSFSDPQEQ